MHVVISDDLCIPADGSADREVRLDGDTTISFNDALLLFLLQVIDRLVVGVTIRTMEVSPLCQILSGRGYRIS